MPGGKKGGGGGGSGGGSGGSAGSGEAQEFLSMQLTSGGVTVSVGVPQDTLQAWIFTKPWDLGHPDKAKWLDKIILHLSNRANQTNMQLEIYGSDDEDGPFVLLQTMSVATQDPLTPDIDAYRYLSLQFIDFGVRERWQLSGFELFGELFGDEF